MKKATLLAVLLTLVSSAFQNAFGQSYKNADGAVKALMSKHIALGKVRNSMPGYRVQIFFGDKREDANLVKSDFLKVYPNVGAYLVYQQPNFKIRVGDFKTRLLATEFLNEIQGKFPMAFLVQDDVKLPR
ncbi:MAG: SPOR domain-containing protein [Bacteroidota bacterium]